jgi:integrase
MASVTLRGRVFWISIKGAPSAIFRGGRIQRPIPRPLGIEGREQAQRYADRVEACLRDAVDYADPSAINQLLEHAIINEAQARALLTQTAVAGAEGDARARPAGGGEAGPAGWSISQAVERFLRDSNYRQNCERFAKWAGEETKASQALTAERLADFRHFRGDQIMQNPNVKDGARAHNHDRQSLSALCNFLVEKGVLPSNTALEALKHFREAKKEIEVLTEEEIQRLYKAAEDYKGLRNEINWRVALKIMLEAALRPSELLHLKWRDLVDLEEPGRAVLQVSAKPEVDWKPKSHEEREIPLRDETAREIREWRDSLPEERCAPEAWVMAWSSNGYRLTDPRVNLDNIWERAGLKRDGIHMLRHTAAIRWVRLGLSVKEVSALLGHADNPSGMQTTMRYIQWVQDRDWKDRARKKLASLDKKPKSETRKRGKGSAKE